MWIFSHLNSIKYSKILLERCIDTAAAAWKLYLREWVWSHWNSRWIDAMRFRLESKIIPKPINQSAFFPLFSQLQFRWFRVFAQSLFTLTAKNQHLTFLFCKHFLHETWLKTAAEKKIKEIVFLFVPDKREYN